MRAAWRRSVGIAVAIVVLTVANVPIVVSGAATAASAVAASARAPVGDLLTGLAQEIGLGPAARSVAANSSPTAVAVVNGALAHALSGDPRPLAHLVADSGSASEFGLATAGLSAVAVIALGICVLGAAETVGLSCVVAATALAVIALIGLICAYDWLHVCSGNSGAAVVQSQYLTAAINNAVTAEGGLVVAQATEANNTALSPSWLAETDNAIDYLAAEQALSQLPNATFNPELAVSSNGYYSPAGQLGTTMAATVETMASYTAQVLRAQCGLFCNDTFYGDLANAGHGLQNITCSFTVGQSLGSKSGSIDAEFAFNTSSIGPNANLNVVTAGSTCDEGRSPLGGSGQLLGGTELDTFGAYNSAVKAGQSSRSYWLGLPPTAYYIGKNVTFFFANQQKLAEPDIGLVLCPVDGLACSVVYGPPNETLTLGHFVSAGYWANGTFACSPSAASAYYCPLLATATTDINDISYAGYYNGEATVGATTFHQLHPTVWANIAVALNQMFGSTQGEESLRASSWDGVLVDNGTAEGSGGPPHTVVHVNGPVEVCAPSAPTAAHGGPSSTVPSLGSGTITTAFIPNYALGSPNYLTWGKSVYGCGSSTNLAFSREPTVVNQEIVAAENVSYAYWEYLREAGYTNVDEVPVDCLIPPITDSWPTTLTAGELNNLTASQAEALYSDYMAELAATFGQPLDDATFCDHHILAPSVLAGTLGLLVEGDVYIPPYECGTVLANETSCAHFLTRSHWAIQNSSLFVQPTTANITLPLNHTWEAPHANPSLVLWGPNNSAYSLASQKIPPTASLNKTIVANLTFVPAGFDAEFAGNSTSPNGSVYPTDADSAYGAGSALYITACWVRVSENGAAAWVPTSVAHPCEASIQVLKTRATEYPCLILGKCGTSPPPPIPSGASCPLLGFLAGPLAAALGGIPYVGPILASLSCLIVWALVIVVGVAVVLAVWREVT